MLKIAIIGARGYPYVYGGYETFVRELVERLNDEFEFHVYCHKRLFNERPSSINGVKLHYIPSIETKSLSQITNSFLSTLHAIYNRYDILFFVNTANGPFGILTRIFKRKTIVNTDGLEWLRPKWKGLGSKYFYWACKASAKYFDVLVSDSEEMRKIYIKLFERDSTVIAYGANIKYGYNSTNLKKYKLNPFDYYLVVGRLIPDNNADIIVKGFLHANTKRKLVIVGDVPYKDSYVDYIRSYSSDSIIFTGYIKDPDELYDLYTNSFAYFHGHEFGGTNPTLLKALAYGCAVLALDTPFSREVLEGQKYGLYFLKEVESVSKSVHYAESNPDVLDKLKRKSRDRIVENYTWEKIANQYTELFLNL